MRSLRSCARCSASATRLNRRSSARSLPSRTSRAYGRRSSTWRSVGKISRRSRSGCPCSGVRACRETLISPFEAIAAAELDQTDRADRLFEAMVPADRGSIALWHVRHLLRTGQARQAITLIDRELEGRRAEQFWPYASIAWRLAGDPRSDWLDAGATLVSVFDLADRLPPLDALADVLRSLHVAKGEYLDQSVRGGTQTDGPLLSRLEPEIQALACGDRRGGVGISRRNCLRTIAKHPLLREPRDRRVRFSGSWSVRLRDAGLPRQPCPSARLDQLGALRGFAGACRRDELGHRGMAQAGRGARRARHRSAAGTADRAKAGSTGAVSVLDVARNCALHRGERLTVAFDVKTAD